MVTVTLQQVASYIRTGKGTPEVVRAVKTNRHIITFLEELDNRAPRFVAMIDDYNAGILVNDILNKWGCCRTTLYRYLRMAGLKMRNPYNGSKYHRPKVY